MSSSIAKFIRELYQSSTPIGLHEPILGTGEINNLQSCIHDGYVSSVGRFVDQFENDITTYIAANGKSVAAVNGTSALHLALIGAGVSSGDFVITQSLTFVATCNAIKYVGADPIFCDISDTSLGLCPKAVRTFLEKNALIEGTSCVHKSTGRKITGLLPMHTFGHPVDIDGLLAISREWNIALIEDCAESFGSFYKSQHTGTFGITSAFSFNGNKIITTGGGGICYSNDNVVADRLKHLSTTAKLKHAYEFHHDDVGFNYRMPNINAALGVAQLQRFDEILNSKRAIANAYMDFFKDKNLQFFEEPKYGKSNYWLNCVFADSLQHRNELINSLMAHEIYCRPAWELMNNLRMFNDCITDGLHNSIYYQDRIICLPSSAILK